MIGPAAHIKGELISSDNVQIEGGIEGKVKCSKQVVIGEKGLVQAEVEAETVSIRGKLEGDCQATGKVEITGSGQVYGNISAPRIAVSEGAIFRGASNMNVETKPAKEPVTTKPESPNPTTSPGRQNHGTSDSWNASQELMETRCDIESSRTQQKDST